MSIQSKRILRSQPSRQTNLLVAILTGMERHFWIHPELLHVCLAMTRWQQETGSVLRLTNIHAKTPIDDARNIAVQNMLDCGAEWLLQIDNDVVPPANILAVFDDIGARKVVGFPSAMEHVHGEIVFNVGTRKEGPLVELQMSIPAGWSEVQLVGSGCLLIHRDVFLALTDPWFECPRELVTKNRQHGGEDFTFCDKARAKGFPVWTHAGFACKHYHTVDLLQMMSAVPRALQEYHEALSRHLGRALPTPADLRKESVHGR